LKLEIRVAEEYFFNNTTCMLYYWWRLNFDKNQRGTYELFQDSLSKVTTP